MCFCYIKYFKFIQFVNFHVWIVVFRNGYSFETSLLLSIFLGMFGIDRFYLGYPALGLLKLSTLGFLFLGQFADVILIATQIVGPADGSHYVMPYYGAGINIIRSNNFTYRVPQYDCWEKIAYSKQILNDDFSIHARARV